VQTHNEKRVRVHVRVRARRVVSLVLCSILSAIPEAIFP
jgi:hypothetical protein